MPLPLGFVPPCLPTKAQQPPTGDAWLHEIKHDGFRVVTRKDGPRVKLYSRPGNDLTSASPVSDKLPWEGCGLDVAFDNNLLSNEGCLDVPT